MSGKQNVFDLRQKHLLVSEQQNFFRNIVSHAAKLGEHLPPQQCTCFRNNVSKFRDQGLLSDVTDSEMSRNNEKERSLGVIIGRVLCPLKLTPFFLKFCVRYFQEFC